MSGCQSPLLFLLLKEIPDVRRCYTTEHDVSWIRNQMQHLQPVASLLSPQKKHGNNDASDIPVNKKRHQSWFLGEWPASEET